MTPEGKVSPDLQNATVVVRPTAFPHSVMGVVSFALNDKIYVDFGSDNKQLFLFNPSANASKDSFDLVITNGQAQDYYMNSGLIKYGK